jgi:hypothetical protein
MASQSLDMASLQTFPSIVASIVVVNPHTPANTSAFAMKTS